MPVIKSITVKAYPIHTGLSEPSLLSRASTVAISSLKMTKPRGYKTCFMLNSAEHEIYLGLHFCSIIIYLSKILIQFLKSNINAKMFFFDSSQEPVNIGIIQCHISFVH